MMIAESRLLIVEVPDGLRGSSINTSPFPTYDGDQELSIIRAVWARFASSSEKLRVSPASFACSRGHMPN